MILHGGTNIIDLNGVTLSGTPATIAGLYAKVKKAVGTGKTVTIGNFKISSALIPPAIASVTMDSTSYVITTEKYVITVTSASAVTATAVSGGSQYELPTASASVLGGVKVGSGLSIDESGVLSATGGGGGAADIFVIPSSTVFTASESVSGLYQAVVSGVSAAVAAGKAVQFEQVAIPYGDAGYGQYYPISGIPTLQKDMAEDFQFKFMPIDMSADTSAHTATIKYVHGVVKGTSYAGDLDKINVYVDDLVLSTPAS